jgi:Restriction endonuclease NaeI
MPSVPLPQAHSDYGALAPLVAAFITAAGGLPHLTQEIPQIIRKAIDEVIDAPRTNRFTLAETEKTEKTYLGTKIEILLRAYLDLPKGNILDLSIAGVETDIKNTMGGNWTIPMEAFGHPCLLLKENEKTALCSVGIIIARDAYLNPGSNRDAKRSFSVAGLRNVWWLLKDHPYPPNFFEMMPLSQRHAIMNAGGGTARLAALFEAVQKKPISRIIVQAIAQQDDYMKRIRRNGGARDVLAPKGIAILWGTGDKGRIEKLKLGPVGPDEFVSYKPTDAAEIALLRSAQHID